jgi:adenylylsulfate kinase-like enzyme
VSSMSDPRFDAVLINGSVGTGKTTTAERLGDELQRLGIPGAVVDVDALRRSWPSPPDDPFRTAVALENVRSVVSTFRRAGARVLVFATVVETSEELRLMTAAVAPRSMLHVHLTVSADEALSRLARRHDDDEASRRWHVKRHPELAAILDRAGFTDRLRIDTTRTPVADVAREILAAIID